MFYLTKHEKGVLIALAVIVFCGVILDGVFKGGHGFEVSASGEKHFVDKTDINKAGLQELVRVPYIGEKTAKRIIAYRQEHGRIRSLEEVQALPGIYPSNYTKMIKYLKI